MTVAESRLPDLVERAEMEAAAEKLQASIDAATKAVRDCEEARDAAEKKAKYAPHGSVKVRLMAFSQATHALLLAEGRLARVMKGAAQ